MPKKRQSSDKLESHMVPVDPDKLRRHTLIIGQSGSGKSFFLGRLIEELMLRTLARCVVIDPNADYFNIESISPGGEIWKWKNFYTQDSPDEFVPAWKAVGIFKKSMRKGTSLHRVRGGKIIIRSDPKFFWHEIPADLLASIALPEGNANSRRAIRAIHELTHKAADAYLKHLKSQKRPQSGWLDIVITARNVSKSGDWPEPKPKTGLPNPADLQNINKEAWNDYYNFNKFCTDQYPTITSVMNPKLIYPADDEIGRLDVIDIASIEDPEIRALATGALILYEWKRSQSRWRAATRKRSFYPTFIVVDEAHNVVPKDVSTTYAGILREQVRTIAAEGRKYGLHLILCSQRPDKLDTRVVSECENVAIMRMVSRKVLEDGCALLGIDFRAATPCLDAPSKQGFGMLFGDWAAEAQRDGLRFRGAALRTAPGGLDPDPKWTKS